MKSSKQQVAVILRGDVEHLGFSGELVTVKPGLARNYLLPRDLAALATPRLVRERTADIKRAEQRRAKEVAEREALAAKLSAEPIALSLKVGPGKQVFGSVTAASVVKAVQDQRGIKLDKQQLSGLPLKLLGTHQVSAKIGLGVVAALTLNVVGEQTKQSTQSPKPRSRRQQPVTS